MILSKTSASKLSPSLTSELKPRTNSWLHTVHLNNSVAVVIIVKQTFIFPSSELFKCYLSVEDTGVENRRPLMDTVLLCCAGDTLHCVHQSMCWAETAAQNQLLTTESVHSADLLSLCDDVINGVSWHEWSGGYCLGVMAVWNSSHMRS